MVPFEDVCRRGGDHALRALDKFLAGTGPVHQSLHRIDRLLRELNVPYAVIGGLALNAHGFRRATIDVDVLITEQGLAALFASLECTGFAPIPPSNRTLRDLESTARIDFFITGNYPGDGKPKPIPFPDPALASIEIDGVHYVTLPHLVELKLASGMTNFGRMKDLADAQQLIQFLPLPLEFHEQLHEYVRPKFDELRHGTQEGLKMGPEIHAYTWTPAPQTPPASSRNPH